MCRGIKTKKIMYDLDANDDFDREMIATYEEVAKLYPRPGVYRPMVLIGAPGVGRNELRRRLIARDPERYRSPVPCTMIYGFFFPVICCILICSVLHRYHSSHPTRRGCRPRIPVRYTRENGGGHCGWTLHREWRIQRTFLWDVVGKCQVYRQRRMCLRPFAALPRHQDIADASAETVHCSR